MSGKAVTSKCVIPVEDKNGIIAVNHPLTGVALNFDVNIVSVRDATKEEIEHGHTHEGDGHSH